MTPLVTYPRTAELSHWINEREAIRHRREAGLPPPWTTDPYMANVRYCNVHREDDKVTRWLRNNPVYSGADVPVWVTVLSRMVNRIGTLESIQYSVARGDLDGVKDTLKHFRDGGTVIWGNAYTISTCGRSMDKVDYVIDHVVRAFMQAGEPEHTTCRNTFAQLMCIDGFGSFLAGQVVADLKNTPGHPLQQATDWDSFAVPGPGSLKGLAAYFGHPATPGTFYGLLMAAKAQVAPLIMPYVGPIHAQDLQNCFCEFSKYIRVREGGRARNKYDPSNNR